MTKRKRPEPTASEWGRFRWGPWGADETVPQEPPDEATRVFQGLPPTLRPVPGGEGVVQRPVFDPSMAQYGKAMRLGEPAFADSLTGERWYAARRRALDVVIGAVAGSRWAEGLVLRGSVLLRAWYGQAAREPGDLDFVVQPPSRRLEDAGTDGMLRDIAHAAEADSRREGCPVLLDSGAAVSDHIWTYDRVPGRRLVIPWSAEGLPSGTVQLDFVFNETLPVPAAETRIPPLEGAGEPVLVRAVTPELSLAWKILWLVSDRFPEGKDLYDAVLLAETGEVKLPFELLRAVFRHGSDRYYDVHPVLREVLDEAMGYVEWYEFAKDHPHLAGPPDRSCESPPEDWKGRLIAALAPTYALDGGTTVSPDERLRDAWLKG